MNSDHLELGSLVRDWMALSASTALLTASRAELKELLLVVVLLGAAAVDSGTGSVRQQQCEDFISLFTSDTIVRSDKLSNI